MKKVLSILLVVISVILLVGCGSKIPERGNNKIAELIDDGYEVTMTSYNENKWCGLMQKDGGFEHVYSISCQMSSSKYEEMSSLDWDDSKYEQKMEAYLTNLEVISCEDIASKVPSESDLEVYKGQKVQKLVDEGYERSGNTMDEDHTILFYDGPEFSFEVYLDILIDDMDNYSENSLKELSIYKVEFIGFSSQIIDCE